MASNDGGALALLNDPRVQSSIIERLPHWVDQGVFMTAALDVFNDPKLRSVPNGSKLRALATCASLGLYPGPQSHVYIVPRGGEITVQVGYKGFAYIARQQTGVSDVTVHLVHETDDIELRQVGPEAWIVESHERDPFTQREWKYNRGIGLDGTGLRGAYVVKHLDDGTTKTHFVPGGRIIQNMRCAQTDSIAKKWPERFFRKTAIRAAWADEFFFGGADELNAAGAAARLHDMESEGSDPMRADVVEVEVKSASASVMGSLLGVDEAVADPDWQQTYLDISNRLAEKEKIHVERVDEAVCAWLGCDDPHTLTGEQQGEVMAAAVQHMSGVEPFPHLLG